MADDLEAAVDAASAASNAWTYRSRSMTFLAPSKEQVGVMIRPEFDRAEAAEARLAEVRAVLLEGGQGDATARRRAIAIVGTGEAGCGTNEAVRAAGVAARQQAEKFARYCELRDEGVCAVDVAREIGLSDTTRRNYEQAYKRLRGIPSGKSAY